MKKNQKNEQNKDIYVNQNLLNIISPSGISFDNNYADIGEGVGKRLWLVVRYCKSARSSGHGRISL